MNLPHIAGETEITPEMILALHPQPWGFVTGDGSMALNEGGFSALAYVLFMHGLPGEEEMPVYVKLTRNKDTRGIFSILACAAEQFMEMDEHQASEEPSCLPCLTKDMLQVLMGLFHFTCEHRAGVPAAA